MVMLAKDLNGQDVSSYWLSEKYDGVRAVWDGREFKSRAGKIFFVPDELKKDMPRCCLDGELWLRRGRFQEAVGIVRSKRADISQWQDIKYMVFDLPENGGRYEDRQKAFKQISLPNWVRVVNQIPCQGLSHFNSFYDNLINRGAEGVILNRMGAFYGHGRTGDLLRKTPRDREEFTVIGYHQGTGRNDGLIGSLICQMNCGNVFKVGTGLSDSDRADPPSIGELVTVEFKGLTDGGKPRHPVLIAVRNYESIIDSDLPSFLGGPEGG